MIFFSSITVYKVAWLKSLDQLSTGSLIILVVPTSLSKSLVQTRNVTLG